MYFSMLSNLAMKNKIHLAVSFRGRRCEFNAARSRSKEKNRSARFLNDLSWSFNDTSNRYLGCCVTASQNYARVKNQPENRRIVCSMIMQKIFEISIETLSSWLKIFSSRCNFAERITLLIVEVYFLCFVFLTSLTCRWLWDIKFQATVDSRTARSRGLLASKALPLLRLDDFASLTELFH